MSVKGPEVSCDLLANILQKGFTVSRIILCIPLSLGSFAFANIYSLRPGQNGRHFTDDVFKCIISNETLNS